MGFLCLWGRSSSIPGSAPELWTSACTMSGLGRSLGAWASALSLYRLIPGQSSEAAAWAMISWKPIKCSWAYFGSGMERGSHSQNSWAPCWFNYKGPLSPRVGPGSLASLLFLAFCKKQKQLRGKTLFRHSPSFFFILVSLPEILLAVQIFCRGNYTKGGSVLPESISFFSFFLGRWAAFSHLSLPLNLALCSTEARWLILYRFIESHQVKSSLSHIILPWGSLSSMDLMTWSIRMNGTFKSEFNREY